MDATPTGPRRIETRRVGATITGSALAASSPPTEWTVNVRHRIECLDGFDAWMRRIENREEQEKEAAAHTHCSGCRSCYRRGRQGSGQSRLSHVEVANPPDSNGGPSSLLDVETTREVMDERVAFHRFADLPTELRLKIWAYAREFWSPSLLSVDILPGDGSDPSASQVWRPTPTATVSLLEATRYSRALLTCCREARYELLEHYIPQTLELTRGTLRFNSFATAINITSLSARALSLLWQAASTPWLPFAAPDFYSLVYLGLDLSIFGAATYPADQQRTSRHDSDVSDDGWLSLLRQFIASLPHLRSVHVVSDAALMPGEEEIDELVMVSALPPPMRVSLWELWQTGSGEFLAWSGPRAGAQGRVPLVEVCMRVYDLWWCMRMSRGLGDEAELEERLEGIQVGGWRRGRLVEYLEDEDRVAFSVGA